MKHYQAERVQFAGGETAILFTEDKCAFGNIIDENDNCIVPVFVIFNPSGQRVPSKSSDCEVIRLGSNGSREYNFITARHPVEVAARQTSFILPTEVKTLPNGTWKFGKHFFRTCLQFVFSYTEE